MNISDRITKAGDMMCSQKSITIVYDGCDSTDRFTANQMKEIIGSEGYIVTLVDIKHLHGVTAQNGLFLTVRGSTEAHALFSQPDMASLPPSGPQGFSVRKRVYEDNTRWYIIGFDKTGMMYGGFDVAETIRLYGLADLKDYDERPYITNRGIKLNIPLDARTPSYSDSGDSAQMNIKNMWDMGFWKEFLDEMAKNRFNVLSLWNLHPFPSMVHVPQYPKVALNDVKKTRTLLTPDLQGNNMSTRESLQNLSTLKVMTIEEKIQFWQDVMQYAADRGIGVYIFTWNTFIYGTEDSGYNFTTSLKDNKTQDYFRKSVEALIKTYPLLKGMGITAGENMSRDAEEDETWLYNTYGQGTNDALAADENRTFRLIHRVHYTNVCKVIEAFSGLNSRCSLDTSFKYSQAHVYASTQPSYIYENEGSYLKDLGKHKTWMTVRDDDYYMFRGGSDSSFVREYIKSIPYEKLKGFYIGADGYNWGREYISKEPDTPNQLVMKKRWYSFMLWGNLSYNPDISQDKFVKMLGNRFPKVDPRNLYTAWSKASQVIPMVNRLHNEGCQMDFQWYPEACTSQAGFHSINHFIKAGAQKGEGIMSIQAYGNALVQHKPTNSTTPIDIAKCLEETSCQVLGLIREMSAGGDKELFQTLCDIEAMAILGKYYSGKIFGAIYKCIADLAEEHELRNQHKNLAKRHLNDASRCWKEYSEKIRSLYNHQTLNRLIPNEEMTPGLPRTIDITELQKDVDNDILLV